ncbi:MAG TPA: hypothetical protein VK138_10340 [Acidiferrobacterales bacterium]|nr:hypothetical protein [Acidiferrobacterales bacterium]
MRTIEISAEVWQAIADQGKFGETEDDVLRRVFKLPTSTEQPRTPSKANGEHPRTRWPSALPRRSFATQRMSSYLNNGQLHISFAGGASRSWSLPGPNDKAALLSMREKAVSFAKEHGATVGQVNAVKKTLTDEGYHLTR